MGIIILAYMPRNATQRAVHRVRILKGLLEKLEVSISEGAYCLDVLKQSLAVQRALKSLDAHILESHLNSCVKNQMKSGDRSDVLRKELLNIYKLSRKEN